MPRPAVRAGLLLLGLGAAAVSGKAQQLPMGTVATRDARVTGSLEVHGEEARLLTNVGITALDRTAPVTLSRGGDVLVCSTSEFHLLRSGGNGALIFGLNRGAMQLQSESRPQDLILTPDMKLVPLTQGMLDFSLRVTPEGDTCVDNAGAKAPTLLVTDAFSSANYRIFPGQHVLFVRGDIHKVVDHERSSCGCPVPRVVAAVPGQSMTPAQAAAAAHPFPEAQSAGLAPVTPPANEAPAGSASTQISTSFTYADGAAAPPVVGGAPQGSASEGAAPGQVSGGAPSSVAPPASHGFGGTLRRFFHRLFHPGGSPAS